MYKFLVADDHPLFREAIINTISSAFPGSSTYETEDIESVDNQTNEYEISPEKISLLTRRELIVLKHLTKGEANKQIAYNLHISETTIKSHVSSILKKLGATNRVKVVVGCGDIDFNQYLKR